MVARRLRELIAACWRWVGAALRRRPAHRRGGQPVPPPPVATEAPEHWAALVRAGAPHLLAPGGHDDAASARPGQWVAYLAAQRRATADQVGGPVGDDTGFGSTGDGAAGQDTAVLAAAGDAPAALTQARRLRSGAPPALVPGLPAAYTGARAATRQRRARPTGNVPGPLPVGRSATNSGLPVHGEQPAGGAAADPAAASTMDRPTDEPTQRTPAIETGLRAPAAARRSAVLRSVAVSWLGRGHDRSAAPSPRTGTQPTGTTAPTAVTPAASATQPAGPQPTSQASAAAEPPGRSPLDDLPTARSSQWPRLLDSDLEFESTTAAYTAGWHGSAGWHTDTDAVGPAAGDSTPAGAGLSAYPAGSRPDGSYHDSLQPLGWPQLLDDTELWTQTPDSRRSGVRQPAGHEQKGATWNG